MVVACTKWDSVGRGEKTYFQELLVCLLPPFFMDVRSEYMTRTFPSIFLFVVEATLRGELNKHDGLSSGSNEVRKAHQCRKGNEDMEKSF